MKRLITSSDALLALQRGLTGDRNLAGTRYMDDPACLTAYADYYLAVSKAQTLRACSLSGLRPSAVLDMGAGPGSVSLALAGLGARSFTLVDSSSRALSMASEALAEMSREYGEPFAVSTLVADLESVALPLPPGVAYDLVAFGHCLNEIGGADAGPVADAAALARSVLVIEPATLRASRVTIALRDTLVAEGWTVSSPCSNAGPCPALASSTTATCHDESGWDVPVAVRRLAERAGLDRDRIKMSWFVLRPPSVDDGVRLEAPPEAPPVGGSYRVVSDSMLNKGGRVRYLLCGREGRFPFSARRDDEAAARAGFFSLGRYDLVSVLKPELRQGGWGFGPRTSIVRLDR
ncbi:MAG: hypothetical protein CVV51_09410 [Spirochaetae bacterium HGW-Spirochaetae-7]|nr:MAG: hypothetical protein CVV51_09410 [Spirochaetae bacterium HGW-Spirochaetae-7]